MSGHLRPILTTPRPARNPNRRRRFMENLLGISSAPNLPKLDPPQTKIEAPHLSRSASCGDLESPGPYSLKMYDHSGSASQLGTQFIAKAGARAQSKKAGLPRVDHFQKLPDELKLKIFGYLQPKELVRASLVSKLKLFGGMRCPRFDETGQCSVYVPGFITGIPAMAHVMLRRPTVDSI